MKPVSKHLPKVLIVVAVAAAVALAGSFLTTAGKAPAFAADGCGMQHNASEGHEGHAAMHGSNNGDPASAKSAAATCAMHGDKHGCVALDGKVTVIGRDGTLTVRVKPTADTAATAKTALAGLKVGDSVSLMMMSGKMANSSAGATKSVAAYACPMHPEVTSDKPGKCPTCGMNLVAAPQKK